MGKYIARDHQRGMAVFVSDTKCFVCAEESTSSSYP